MNDDLRPNPDEILKRVSAQEAKRLKGRLRIFLGMSAGVGKTFAMLKAAHARKATGARVLVGLVETHGRQETEAVLSGLEVLPRKKLDYKGVEIEEFDIDEVLKRRPDLVLVDELAHTNAPGSRHPKRYQDVLELLSAGLDVYTTMNVQHLESRKDLVEKITGVPIRETVPDPIFELADQIEVIDIAPNDLLVRLKEGKVYLGDRAARAAQNFFKVESLTALREMALRFTAEKVDQELQSFHEMKGHAKPWQSSERLMVAVSHSPFSETLIRAARRLAYNLEAPWVAVHVDTGTTLTPEDQVQLNRNIALARELNAEIVSTSDRDVASALKRVARQKNTTQLLVGRPTKRWIRDLFEGGTLLDRLVRDSWDVDVHVLRQNELSTYTEGFHIPKLNFSTGFIPYWNTLWALVGISFLSALIEKWIGYQAVGFLFLLGVLVIGRLGSLGPTIFAAALSAFSWNFFFIPPRMTFAISEPEDAILLAAFFIVAAITGTLTSRLREHEILLRDREERANVLYEILKEISSSATKDEFLARVSSRIGHVLSGHCSVLLKSRDAGLTNEARHLYSKELSEKEFAVARWTFEHRQPAGWSTDTLASADSLYVPLTGNDEIFGVLVFTPAAKKPLSAEQSNLLQSVCRQLGLSLERHFVQKRVAEAEKLRESEHLHQTLLNSISHEMRTPLTAILGSAAALADPTISSSALSRETLTGEILSAGDRLNRVIENLLDMSRLSSGALALNKEWHDLHDLIGVTVSRLSRSLKDHQVKVISGDDLPLVNIDYRLMEHALSNLIQNASLYSSKESEIQLETRRAGDFVELVISDRGVGVPEESLERIFEKFYRAPNAPTGGTGLGLSIVRSIIELHGGSIHANLRPGGGLEFTIRLPSKNAPGLPFVTSEPS